MWLTCQFRCTLPWHPTLAPRTILHPSPLCCFYLLHTHTPLSATHFSPPIAILSQTASRPLIGQPRVPALCHPCSLPSCLHQVISLSYCSVPLVSCTALATLAMLSLCLWQCDTVPSIAVLITDLLYCPIECTRLSTLALVPHLFRSQYLLPLISLCAILTRFMFRHLVPTFPLMFPYATSPLFPPTH